MELYSHDHLVPDPLPIHERIALAKRRGDDILVAAIEEGYGTSVIRNLSAPRAAADIRALAKSARKGLNGAANDLRLALALYLPDVVSVDAWVSAIVEAS